MYVFYRNHKIYQTTYKDHQYLCNHVTKLIKSIHMRKETRPLELCVLFDDGKASEYTCLVTKQVKQLIQTRQEKRAVIRQSLVSVVKLRQPHPLNISYRIDRRKAFVILNQAFNCTIFPNDNELCNPILCIGYLYIRNVYFVNKVRCD